MVFCKLNVKLKEMQYDIFHLESGKLILYCPPILNGIKKDYVGCISHTLRKLPFGPVRTTKTYSSLDNCKEGLFVDLICFFLSCGCCTFVCVCLYVPCGHLLGKG